MAPKFIVRTSFTTPVPYEVCFFIRLTSVIQSDLVESASLHKGALVRYLTLFGDTCLA